MRVERAASLSAGLAVAWLALLGFLSFVVQPDVHLDALVGLAPLAACAALSARATAGFAAAALALTGWLGAQTGVWTTTQQWVRLFDAAAVSAAAVVIASVRARREREFNRLTNISQIAQQAVLPVVPAEVPGVAVASRYESASEDAFVGGDLYDCSWTEGYTRFIIGDVRGKGIAAVGQAARVIRSFRQAAATKETLSEVVADMDTYLQSFFGPEEFVTAAVVDVTTPGRLKLVSCGHQPALLVRANGDSEFLDGPAGLPLGLGHDPDPVTVRWEPGDRLLLYTDGMSEARDRAGAFFPLREPAALLREGSLDDALDALLDRLFDYVPRGHLGDDLAAVLLENVPTSVSGTGGREALAAVQDDAGLVP
jgi:serine phosphatase RsbU (regulator of sigma subunit)